VVHKIKQIENGKNRVKSSNRLRQPVQLVKVNSKKIIPKTSLALAFERARSPQF
jgi:hypothetical protein